MMKRETYKQTVNYFKKSDVLYVERIADIYYICDGHIVIKLDSLTYKMYFASVTPIFPILEDGERTTAQKGRGNIPEKTGESGVKISQLFNKVNALNIEKIKISPFLQEYADGQVRICGNENFAVLISETLFQAAKPFVDWSKDIFCSGRINPIFQDCDFSGFMILPVNAGKNNQDVYKTMLKAAVNY